MEASLAAHPHLPHTDRTLAAPPCALSCFPVPDFLNTPSNPTYACVPPALCFKPDSIKVNNNTKTELSPEGEGMVKG